MNVDKLLLLIMIFSTIAYLVYVNHQLTIELLLN